MPTSLTSVPLVVALLAFMLWRDNRRLRAVEAWMAPRGFVRHITMPPDLYALVQAATDGLRPNRARILGLTIDGHIDGRRFIISEYEASRGVSNAPAWLTMVMSPVVPGTPELRGPDGALPAGLPDGLQYVRHERWDLVCWEGHFTIADLETVAPRLPPIFSAR